GVTGVKISKSEIEQKLKAWKEKKIILHK
ncbi:30S ribosomal protein S16, partial [Candidatus Sulcia muelleri]|nr:30S ribosomal protein S16 [Candidatus Karelsulcia muelleri]